MARESSPGHAMSTVASGYSHYDEGQLDAWIQRHLASAKVSPVPKR